MKRIIIYLLLSTPLPVHAQGQMRTIAVTGESRELLSVLRQLERLYGWRANYEDPPYECVCDLMDTLPQASRAAHPGARFLVPIPHPINISFQEPDDHASDVARTRVIDAGIRQATVPGERGFRAQHDSDLSHVSAILARKKDGSAVDFVPVLDTAVSFPSAERTVGEVVDLIHFQVASKRGIPITFGTIPTNFFLNTQTSWAATNEPARTVLVRLFDDADAKRVAEGGIASRLVWRLLYDANEKVYFFNAHVVQMANVSSKH